MPSKFFAHESLVSPGSEEPFITSEMPYSDFLTRYFNSEHWRLLSVDVVLTRSGFQLHVYDEQLNQSNYYGNLSGEAVIGLFSTAFVRTGDSFVNDQKIEP